MGSKTPPGSRSSLNANTRPKNQQMYPKMETPTFHRSDQQWPVSTENEQLNMNFEQLKFKPPFINAESQPHTPIDQNPPNGLAFDYRHRFGSVSSVATTDDEDPVNEITYPWNNQQDETIKNVYEEILSMPQITPFTGSVPPSGLLQRVAKDSIRKAKFLQVYFPHSINAVRQRVVELYHPEQINAEELEKMRIPRDYFSVLYDNNMPSSDMVDEDFEFSDVMASNRRASIEEKYNKQFHTSPQLAAPFKEHNSPIFDAGSAKGPPGTLSEKDIVNIVAKRKRDSLRLKRGQF